LAEHIPASAHPMDVMRTAVSMDSVATVPEKTGDHSGPGAPRPRDALIALPWLDGSLVSLEPSRQRIASAERHDRRTFLHLLQAVAHPRRGCARCTRRSLSTPSTNSTRRTFTARVIAGTGSDLDGAHWRHRRIAGSKTRRCNEFLSGGSERYGTPDEAEAASAAVRDEKVIMSSAIRLHDRRYAHHKVIRKLRGRGFSESETWMYEIAERLESVVGG